MSDSEEILENLTPKEATIRLWEMGEICQWKLDFNQLEIVNKFLNNPARIQVVAMSRQTGKTYCLLTMGIEVCLKKANQIVVFVAPAQNQARKIAKTTVREILEDCPEHLMPEYKSQDNVYVFPNGSQLEIIGNNAGRIEGARGPKANLILCDEVGFWDDLAYAIKSVLFPKLNTTRGKLLMASTPPKSHGHEFYAFKEDAEYRRALTIRTIYDCPRYTEEEITEFADECGGFKSNDFRREYLCEFIVDTSLAVIPEATEELMKEIVMEWERPPFFDSYVCMDLGLKDLTFVIFAYFDFRAGKVIIENEFVSNNPEELRTDKLAYKIYDMEQELWGELAINGENYEPHLRISDIDHFVINDLYLQHGLMFIPTTKDDQDIMVNNLRMMMSSKKIIIHPRCKELVFHLKNAVWRDMNKKKMDRSPDAGHYDGVDALKYLVRNIHYHKNPYPPTFDLNLNSQSFISPHFKPKSSSFKEGIKDLYSLKSRNKKDRNYGKEYK